MERLILSVVERHPLDSANSLGQLNTLRASTVDAERALRAVEIVVAGRDAAVATIDKDGGGLGNIDSIVQGGVYDIVPEDTTHDHKHDGVDRRSQNGRLAGHEESLGPRGDGQQNAGRQKEEQKTTEQVHLYLNAGL
jgi:hypothetical protein